MSSSNTVANTRHAYVYYVGSNPTRPFILMKTSHDTFCTLDTNITYTKEYVEWSTGGPGGCQVDHGGTCQRPDIFINNGKYCNTCLYYEFCLCGQKRLKPIK